MNVQGVNFYSVNSNYNRNYQSNVYQAVQNDCYQSSDSVSFCGATATIADFFRHSLDMERPKYERKARKYLAALENVALKLTDKGVQFDRGYNELCPVKSTESTVSKILRSKEMHVTDRIRATMYNPNLSDITVVTQHIIPEMEKQGFKLADTTITLEELVQRGYIPTPEEAKDLSKKVKIADLDIRLANISPEQVAKLPPELRYCIGKPAKSGYKDLQLKFVEKDAPKNSPSPDYELIVLYGKNYAKAKHLESKRIYGVTREFDRLRIHLDNEDLMSSESKARRQISVIKKMFTNNISKKLFWNAENRDIYGITEELPMKFEETDVSAFEQYFADLCKEIGLCYKNRKMNAISNNENLMQLIKDEEADKKLLVKIKDSLRDTIRYFNEEYKPQSVT